MSYCSVIKKYDLLFLGKYLCEADCYVMKYMPKDIVLIRDKVLSKGDEICEFKYKIIKK
ncbi:L-2-amino-thiazoline-4-carboxylic acid hydrolase [Clostridium sporogenes]|uniref:L-2-amino-thiazoline-4-carboxylic acid hydrolase n=1 Tax=Clostridium sporogenes TaxID=1509 RepID=UPI002237EB94|nr:L-2-amino-thiazoline-4-carboxylic acid hydrolase [Clostridium sporogenes]EKS4342684.1 L-2-amino-thiazoline-4-carboxylic acid hydrolase [Clostridium botulinum]EKS4395460.1 L-2-amino-thiazoline-4-carboxylic acid hydrolase [Clostridium botulinum]MCW6077741.1 L-2-amino-thiazoline-4-carboxylic acid hydrolase [Clostridium sporogenes]